MRALNVRGCEMPTLASTLTVDTYLIAEKLVATLPQKIESGEIAANQIKEFIRTEIQQTLLASVEKKCNFNSPAEKEAFLTQNARLISNIINTSEKKLWREISKHSNFSPLELKHTQLKIYEKNFVAQKNLLEQEKELAEKIKTRLTTILTQNKVHPSEYTAIKKFLSNNKKRIKKDHLSLDELLEKIIKYNHYLQKHEQINSPDRLTSMHEKLRDSKNALTKAEKSLQRKKTPTANKLMPYLSSMDPALELLDETVKLIFSTQDFLNQLEKKIDTLPKNQKRIFHSLGTLLHKTETQVNTVSLKIGDMLKTAGLLTTPENDHSSLHDNNLFNMLLSGHHPTYTYLLNHKNNTLPKFEQMLYDFKTVISSNENLSPHDRISHAYTFVKLFNPIIQRITSTPAELNEQIPKIPTAYLSDTINQQLQACYALVPELKEKFTLLHKQAYEIFAGNPSADGAAGTSQLHEIYAWLSAEKNYLTQEIEKRITWIQEKAFRNAALLSDATDMLQRTLDNLNQHYKKYMACSVCLQEDLGKKEPYSLHANKQLLQSCIELAHELGERTRQHREHINQVLNKKLAEMNMTFMNMNNLKIEC